MAIESGCKSSVGIFQITFLFFFFFSFLFFVFAIRFNNYYFYFKRPISDSSRNTRWIDHTHLLLYKLILPSKKYNDKLIRQKYKLIMSSQIDIQQH